MTDLTFYDNAGRIRLTFSGTDDIVQQVQQANAQYYFYEGVYDSNEYYFLDNLPTLRPEQSTVLDKVEILANGTDALTLSSAPTEAHFRAWNLSSNVLIEGTFSSSETFTSTVTGTIRIVVEKFPYKTFEAFINAI